MRGTARRAPRRKVLLALGVLAAGCGAGPPPRGPWQVPEEAERLTSPVVPGPGELLAGAREWAVRCASCHGEHGRGDGRSAGVLTVPPGDLAAPGTCAQTDGALYWKITTGRLPMPGFRRRLSDRQRWQLVAYLRLLQLVALEPPRPSTAVPAPPAGPPPAP